MSSLLKACEIEQYVGLPNGEVLPLSPLIAESLDGFAVEPDQRNIEYIVSHTSSYPALFKELIDKRMKLRHFLSTKNPDWTVIPGSTISLPFSSEFIFSKTDEPYYQHIQQRHGTSVVTSSVHYHIGGFTEDKEELIRIANLLRTEASLILALTASSPFHNGQITGKQSYRWASFPLVPSYTPFFDSYEHYVDWSVSEIDSGEMFNSRHFWSAVRPNGPDKPRNIDHLEIRIADISSDWSVVLAIMAWIEMRTVYFARRPELVLRSKEDHDIAQISDESALIAASYGLAGHFSDWLYEEETTHYEAIQRRLEENSALSAQLGLSDHLHPLEKVLAEGNEATQQLQKIHDGYSLEQVMQEWIEESLRLDQQAAQKSLLPKS